MKTADCVDSRDVVGRRLDKPNFYTHKINQTGDVVLNNKQLCRRVLNTLV